MQYIIKQVKVDEPDNFWRYLYWTGKKKKWITCRCNTILECCKYPTPSAAKRAIANKTPFNGMRFEVESTDKYTVLPLTKKYANPEEYADED